MNRRILHVPRRFVAEEWGGTETVLLEISRQQQRADWVPEIFTSMALSGHQTDTIGGIPVRRFPYFYPFLGISATDRILMDKKGGNLVSPALCRALLRAGHVRLFHAHALGRVGGAVRAAARWQGKPWVLSLHGGVFDVPTSEFNQMMQPMKRRFDWARPLDAWCGTRRLLNDADQIICVGSGEVVRMRREVNHDRITYLPNGVDPSRFTGGDGPAFRRKHGIPDEAFLVLNISRIDAQKNQLALLEAVTRLRAARKDCRLVLIGPETQAPYAARLRDFIRERELTDSVKILPGLRHDDPELANAYQACDAFALPSVHEPFGIVVLEAWSASKPVVVSRTGGLRTLVTDEETGLFFDPAELDAAETLAARLERLADDPELRRRLGGAGREEVLRRYAWPEVVRQLELIYHAAEEHAARRKRNKQQ